MLSCALKSKLYNTCILPIFLYGSDCWAISKTDACKIDALDQWCMRMLLGIKWYQFVRNDDEWDVKPYYTIADLCKLSDIL